MLKKLSLVMLVLLFTNIVAAAEIEIYLNEYEGMVAKIQIENNADVTYNDIHLSIDGAEPKQVANAIVPGTAVIISERILSGSHNLKVTTKEGVSAEKRFSFAKSLNQIVKEKEEGNVGAVPASEALNDINFQILKAEQQDKVAESLKLQEEALKTEEEKAAAIVEKPKLKFNTKIVTITVIVLLLFFGIIYYVLKGKRSDEQQQIE